MQVLTNSPATTHAQRNYDQSVVTAVQHSWFALLERQNIDHARLDFAGTNLLQFELSVDGRVKSLTWVQESGSKVMDWLCEGAIKLPAPYGRWPDWQEHGNNEVRTFGMAFLLPRDKN